MPSVCFYFEVHQPYRLKPYGALQVGRDHDYFDEKLNAEVLRKVANTCYLPANEAMLRMIERTDGRFRASYALTGVVIEQMKLYAPEVLDSFVRLAKTGSVELIAETYYHTLAALYDKDEYRDQIEMEMKLIESEFGQVPRVFRNTELIYNDEIGQLIADEGFNAMIIEGADDVLDWRSPNFVYRVAGRDMKLLVKNYKLSDDIAFRFSNKDWSDYPLTAEKFAGWIHGRSGAGDVVNLFMDYETFGEHQWKETGIFDFLEQLPDLLFTHPQWDILTPSQVVDRYPALGELPCQRTVSWADEARDVSAWQGNAMQQRALAEIYSLGSAVRRRNNSHLLALWRRLQTSDHFYYMATKSNFDAAVHDYFSPYEGPYDAFIHYMNVMKDLNLSVLATAEKQIQL
ncbi:MAG: glycoside hydrolase family 57 protein [Deltaproteobacteria bacterium]|nr:glycoside hydrolase family 57 protein [Deltaproteobacteria bacterium]NND30014.1 alpha-amylase [Myxococcales bacterium]MBT8466402.1 glycoside hydrolase family 57 protein [Deltaproteobacteria bacterium]MBT8480854.1 glycoside hydrolase family 57 protein [Deltaproteobacteria bacterium]NNK08125.1 alpha-amylase [Myxococcales bacterium]